MRRKNRTLRFRKHSVIKQNSTFGFCFQYLDMISIFGRTEVMDELSITASPASELIKKMLNLGVIYPMKGKGKGKYLFVRRHEESD